MDFTVLGYGWNQIESAVIDFVWLRSELKKVILEVEGHVPVLRPSGDRDVETETTTSTLNFHCYSTCTFFTVTRNAQAKHFQEKIVSW